MPSSGLERMLAEGADGRDLVDRAEPDRHLQVEAHALARHINISLSECHYPALVRSAVASLHCINGRLSELTEQAVHWGYKAKMPYNDVSPRPEAMATLAITSKGQVTLRQELLRHLGDKLATASS